jgi:hypothetical protein
MSQPHTGLKLLVSSIMTGPSCGDLYHGPALSALDKAVQDAAGAGLQILLDLHGCPGGENGLRPCGRAKRSWCQRDWRVQESLEVCVCVCVGVCVGV